MKPWVVGRLGVFRFQFSDLDNETLVEKKCSVCSVQCSDWDDETLGCVIVD